MAKKRALKIVLALILITAALRLCLPFLVRSYVNRTLHNLKDYDGHVAHVRLGLLRGAYQIRDVQIVKKSGGAPSPFFEVRKMDLSVQWRQLVHRAIVGEIVFFEPQINLVMATSDKKSQFGHEQNWTDVVRKLFPVKINRLEVRNGSVHYRDFGGQPSVDVFISSINATATNLTNSEKVSESLAADIWGTGIGMKTANLDFAAHFDPYNPRPTFNVRFKMENLNVTDLNGFLRHYADIDVEKGTMSLYLEATAKDGRLNGYAKPFLKDIKVIDLKREKLTLGQAVKEGFVQLLAGFFKNPKQQTTATRIPFSHTIEDPKLGFWPAIGSSFHHVFIQALHPSLDEKE